MTESARSGTDVDLDNVAEATVTDDNDTDEVASALDFLLREFERRAASAGEAAGDDDTLDAAALRGKRAAYIEAREAIQHVIEKHRIKRRWQRVHERKLQEAPEWTI